MRETGNRPELEVDPDPFSIGLALLGLVVAGGSFLETRRQRQLQIERDTNRYRTRWYNARRTLLTAHQVVDEFQTFVAGRGFGDNEFGFGQVRLSMSRNDVRQFRSMMRRIGTATNAMAADIDALSEFLGPENQDLVNEIMEKVEENQRPHSYDAVIILAKDAIDSFDQLIEQIGNSQGFGGN